MAPWVVVHEGQGPADRGGVRLVERLLAHAGVEHPPLAWVGVRSQKVKDARLERQEVRARLEELRPARTLTMGAFALMVARGDEAKPMLLGERGRMQAAPWGGLLLPTIPAMWTRADPEYFRDLARDVMKWGTAAGPVDLEPPDWVEPADAAGLLEALAPLRDAAALAVDVETSGLDPLRDELLSVGVGAADGPVVIIPRAALVDPAVADVLWAELWPDPLRRVVFHNAKFDLKFLARWWGTMPTTEGARVSDTMLLSHLLDERPARSKYRAHGLKDLARTRYDVEDYHFDFELFHARLRGDAGTEPLAEADWEALHAYHALDVRVTARLWRDLVEQARDEPALLAAHDTLLAPAVLALAEAELAGVPVDAGYVASERARLERRIARRHRALISFLARHDGGEPGDATLKPTAPAQFKDVLLRRFGITESKGGTYLLAMANRMAMYRKYAWDATGFGGDRPVSPDPVSWPNTTNAAANPMSSDMTNMHALIIALLQAGRRHEARWVAAVLEQRLDMKYLSTYIEGFETGVGPDGRVHADFNLAGTVTGRLASSNPNLHAIPKRGGLLAFRRAIRARPGWTLVEADYSQLELRVAAILSGDKALTRAYADGLDLHMEVAAVMFGKPTEEVTDAERYLAKALDFGVIYGRGAEAIMDDIRDVVRMEVPWTLEQAEEFSTRFLDGYPELRDWLIRTGEDALRDRYVDTPFGRRRRLIMLYKVKRDVAVSARGSARTAGWIRAIGVGAVIPENSGNKLGVATGRFMDPRRLLRQAVNTPIQSTASDICLSAFSRLSAELDPDDAVAVSLVHDSILVEARLGDPGADPWEDALALGTAAAMRRVMEWAPIDTRGVPLQVDVKVGRSLADDDMHKVKQEVES